MNSVHPVAQLFPPMTDGEYAALRDDIKQNGQREPVTLWRGQIIDGVHRARACKDLGRECVTRDWDGDEAGLVAYVVSLNLHRRHLNESQRAMVAAKIATREPGQHGTTSIDNVRPPTLQEAANLLNVAKPTVQRAGVVRKLGVPELVDAVESGQISVNRGAEIARLPDSKQRKAMADPKARNPNLFKHPTKGPVERVERAIETMGNIAEVLGEAMEHMNGDKRKADWAARLRPIRTTISRFIAECER